MTGSLSLNAQEAMYLLDRVVNQDFRDTLVLKLASVFDELVSIEKIVEGEREVIVTEEEAWCLRSKVGTTDRIPSDTMFGLKLCKKIYRLLLDYENAADLDMTEERPGYDKDKLRAWREQDAHSNTDPNRTGDDPGYAAV